MDKPDWMLVYEGICTFCDPDDPHCTNYGQMHEDCFDKFTWLVQFRLDTGLQNGMLPYVLGIYWA